MKKLTFAALAAVSVLLSCEREDLSAFVGNSLTDEVTDVTSVSFTLHASFTLDAGPATSSQVGFFLDDEPGITSGKYDIITPLAPISNGGKRYNLKFSNIGDDNRKLYPAGTTVYCRSFIKVTDTDFNTHKYVMGDEVSFEIPEAECTIMTYGVGGTTLDWYNLSNLIVPMLKKGTNGTVEATFMFKQSEKYQTESGYNLLGANRWILPLEGVFSEIWDDSKSKVQYIKYASNLIATFAENVGDSKTDMSDPATFAEFIDWSMQTCPAKTYVILMRNHGGGWDFYDDKTLTKAQLFDDNNDNCMSIDNFVAGVKASSIGEDLSAVIFDECLMATMENLGEVSSVTECVMAAEETTYGLKGDKLMSRFESGIQSMTPVFDILSGLADDYVDAYPHSYTDFGVYNLYDMDWIFSSVGDITEFLKTGYSSSSDWKVAISGGLTNAMWASGWDPVFADRKKIMVLKEKVKDWDKLSDEQKDAVVEEIAQLNQGNHYEFSFYDFVAQCIKSAEQYLPLTENPAVFGEEIDGLKTLLSDYDTCLRSMSYITCTKPETSDTPYEYTSLSVCLQSLHPSLYTPITKTNLYGYPKADKISRTDALAEYKELEFDKATSWSEFLEMIMMSGTPFFNPDRQFRQEGN